jgi:hypothetical protein
MPNGHGVNRQEEKCNYPARRTPTVMVGMMFEDPQQDLGRSTVLRPDGGRAVEHDGGDPAHWRQFRVVEGVLEALAEEFEPNILLSECVFDRSAGDQFVDTGQDLVEFCRASVIGTFGHDAAPDCVCGRAASPCG